MIQSFDKEGMQMWKNIKNPYVDSIEKCVGEYDIRMMYLFPFVKCKVKIYKKQNGDMYGKLNIKIKNGSTYEQITSFGRKKKEVLINMLDILIKLSEQYPDGLDENEIQYLNYWEF